MKQTSLCIFLAILFAGTLCCPARAEEVLLTAEHTYHLGDSDSKSEARRLCYLEAKRKLLEQAGVYTEAVSRTENFQLAQDEILSFSAAILNVNTDKEEWNLTGESFSLTMVVSARVDLDEVKARLEKLVADRNARQRLNEDHEREKALEDELLARPQADTTRDAEALHQEREKHFRTLDELQRERQKILAEMDRATELAATLPEKGMTIDEVLDLMGMPRAEKGLVTATATYQCANFGRAWVVFKDGLVRCVRKRLEYDPKLGGDCHCEGFGYNFILR